MTTNIDKKKNGVFYTPYNIACILSNWAIQSPKDLILEPSFGGCDFIKASKERLAELSNPFPPEHIFGSDIDPAAFRHLAQIVDLGRLNGNFLQNDFLRLRLGSFPVEGFDVVIGNPPYVSHHNMSNEQYSNAQKALKEKDYNLDGRASLWAYFVLHSLSFLKIGGRIAWILPSSLLYSDYSNIVKETLRINFKSSLILYLKERLFVDDGTEEISLIVLAKDRTVSNEEGTIQISFVENGEELENTIVQWENDIWSGAQLDSNPRLSFLPEDAQNVFKEITNLPATIRLGETCQIKIGIVSGANDFFIISPSAAKEKDLPDETLKQVLTRFKHTKGMVFSSEDMEQLEKDDSRCWLVDTTQVSTLDGALEQYLKDFSPAHLSRTTFVRRMKSGEWHHFNDNQVPDAFFPYMRTTGPRIVLNTAEVNCTNAIHRLYFHDEINVAQRKAIAISILSSFSQLSAEVEGRTYGAGVLKLEPSEALRIHILLPEVDERVTDETFHSIHCSLLEGKSKQARSLADEFIVQEIPEQYREYFITTLQDAIFQAKSQRLP